ncbi:MAG: DNA primase [bacterium]
MIEAETIEEIKDKAEIVSVISNYVILRKAGKNHVGLCPFHNEKTPSFSVSPDKQMFYCFGCHEGGNALTFIMKIENLNFGEAVELLAEKLGIEVKKTNRSTPPPSENNKYYDVLRHAIEYFKYCLNDPKLGHRTRAYLEHRHVSDQAIDLFGLGYAPKDWQGLFNYMNKKGVDTKAMVHLGLAMPRPTDNSYYDRFRERLMFPIFDLRDRPIAFGGRALDGTDPKYMNSPDSSIFNKSNILYGLNRAKDEIKKNKTAILVEGYMDLIAVYSAGFKNVVAPLGTSFTDSQAKLLSRYANTAIIAFDSDMAGELSTERTVEILRNHNLSVRVLNIAKGKDPDEFIKLEGKETFAQALANSLPWLQYRVDRILKNAKLSEVESRVKAISELARILSQEKDSLIREEYVREISRNTRIAQEVILSEIKKLQYGRRSSSSKPNTKVEKPAAKIIWAEEFVLRLAVENNDYLDKVKRGLLAEDFTDPLNKQIAGIIFESRDQDPKYLYDHLPSDDVKKAFSKISVTDNTIINPEQTLNDCIVTIKAHHLNNRMKDIQEQIKLSESRGDSEKLKSLYHEFDQTSGTLRTLHI